MSDQKESDEEVAEEAPDQPSVQADASQEKPRKVKKAHKKDAAAAMTLPVSQQHPEPVPQFLPENFQPDLMANHFHDYAAKHFTTQKTGGIFSKKTMPLDAAMNFSIVGIKTPLLEQVPKPLAKQAILLFKCILKYCNVRPSKQSTGTIGEFIKIVKTDPSLIDEAYCQVVRQTNGAPEEALKPALALFLTMTTIFVPSTELIPFLRSHLARLTNSAPNSCQGAAYLAYIRLCARADAKTNVSDTTDAFIESIPSHPSKCLICFNNSLYEQMFNQRNRYPRLAIPLIMHQMGEALFKNGCEKTPGIFRVVGNLNQMGPIKAKANNGEEFLEGLSVTDISSLFKEWCRDIPGGIIDETHMNELMKLKSSEEYLTFANKLPQLPKNALMYLSGFLRKLALSQSITLMGAQNLAMVFALNVSYLGDESPNTVSTISAVNQAFLQTLINSWDVSPIYPVPAEALLQQN